MKERVESDRGPTRLRVAAETIEGSVERAIAYLLSQRLDARKTADGRNVGIQATVVVGAQSPEGFDLYGTIDRGAGEVAHPSSADTARGETVGDRWRNIAGMLERRLGFPLEPELFSNMLFVATLGRSPHAEVVRLTRVLLETFRDSDLDGLYHFFITTKFACDIDCTAMAARARLNAGDIDPSTAEGAISLRRITQRILKSAAVGDVPAEANRTHGKENGPLRRLVAKVYPDDHDLQGPGCDRGLKNNPVVVANALYPVLFELRAGLRSPAEVVALREFFNGEEAPREGSATVAEIVAANVHFVSRHLLSGDYRSGCRYYASPDAFLCFFSECFREFPELFEPFGVRWALEKAILGRRTPRVPVSEPVLDPGRSLNTAWRMIAARNVGLEPGSDLPALLERQGPDGGWKDLDALYSFGALREVQFRSTAVTTAFALQALTLRGEVPAARCAKTWTGPLLDEIVKTLS